MFDTVAGFLFEEYVNALRLESALHAENVDPVDHRIDPDARYWMTADRRAGYGIAGNGELKYVFSTTPGMGNAIVTDAVANGADNLNCFEGHLTDLYARHGFVETHRLDNWDPAGPAVVFMRRLPASGNFLDVPEV